jgi:4-hydroxy-tetrahydrodipicolinate synthase
MPREAHDICQLYFDGKVKESAALQLRLLELCNTLFCEVNPIPVKTAMAALGYCAEEFRLPMCEMEDGNKEKLYTVLRKVGLLK